MQHPLAAGRARAGKAPPGRSVDPAATPPQQDTPQPAPPHGTPVDAHELARLKRRARHQPPASDGPAQDEDEGN